MGKQSSRDTVGGRRPSQASQISRKRELDRSAQRASRERVKNRIAFLEEKLARLEAGDENAQISDLMQRISNLQNENSRLRAILLKIRAWTDVPSMHDTDALPSPPSSTEIAELCSQTGGPSSESPTSNATNVLCAGITTNDQNSCDDMAINGLKLNCESTSKNFVGDKISKASLLESPRQESDDVGNLFSLAAEDFEDPSLTSSSNCNNTLIDPSLLTNKTIMPSPLGPLLDFDSTAIFWSLTHSCPQSNGLPDEAKWHFANASYAQAIDSSRKITGDQYVVEQHAPFSALLSSWDSLDEDQRSHPVWTSLRDVDQNIFAGWSAAKKIAIMFVTHKVMLYLATPTSHNLENIPSFLRPRPSQERFQHPTVIDFLVWPGLRERLVFTHERYSCNGNFSAAYCAYTRFNWPFPDQYIFTCDSTGTHRISKLFKEFAFDPENWTMDEHFFKSFPEMENDIPCSYSPSRSLDPTAGYYPQTAILI